MMKNIPFLKSGSLSLLIFIFIFTSCQKVIDLDLNSAAPQIIIEGTVTDQPGPYNVKITQTVNYNEPNVIPVIPNATVIISDNLGNIDTLSETTPGNYNTTSLQGLPGRTYTLKINVNGKEYVSVSTMPYPVSIDTIQTITQTTPKGSNKFVSVKITDPTGVANYYRFIKVINNVVQSTIFIEDDLMQDGNTVKIPLLSKKQTEVKLIKGDTITVLLQSVDVNVYNSFRTLLQLFSSGEGPTSMLSQSASPANPQTNISNGALGYFSACAVTSKTTIVR
jgi:hypothetical protein